MRTRTHVLPMRSIHVMVCVSLMILANARAPFDSSLQPKSTNHTQRAVKRLKRYRGSSGSSRGAYLLLCARVCKPVECHVQCGNNLRDMLRCNYGNRAAGGACAQRLSLSPRPTPRM